MTHPTHQLIGAAAALPVATALTAGPLILVALAASTLGSLLPDADHADAAIYQPTRAERDHPPLNLLGYVARLPLKLVALLPHRGPLTHGFPALVWVLTAVMAAQAELPPIGVMAAIGAAAGYLAHLAADGATETGLPGYPFCKRVYTMPRVLRVKTGSRGETRYAIAAAVAFAATAAGQLT